MELRSENDVKGIVEEMAEDRGRAMNRASARKRTGQPSGGGGLGKALIFGAVAVAVLLVAFFLLSGKGERHEDEALRRLAERVDRIELRLEQLEPSVKQSPALVGRIEGLGKSISRLKSDQQTLLNRLDQLSRRIQSLDDRAASGGTSPTTHTVQRGETLFSIAKRYGLEVDALCELNGIQRQTVIQPGQKLVVTP